MSQAQWINLYRYRPPLYHYDKHYLYLKYHSGRVGHDFLNVWSHAKWFWTALDCPAQSKLPLSLWPSVMSLLLWKCDVTCQYEPSCEEFERSIDVCESRAVRGFPRASPIPCVLEYEYTWQNLSLLDPVMANYQHQLWRLTMKRCVWSTVPTYH